VLPIARLATLISALTTLLSGCTSTGSPPHCNVPAIPKIGATGGVQVTPLPDLAGYRVHFKDRDGK